MDGDLGQTMQVFDPSEDARAFRDALGSFATGVTIVTAPGPDGPMGITASSFASVSLDPPLVLWSPQKSSRRFPVFRDATHYAIHVLDGHQQQLCNAFTRDAQAFDGLDVVTDENGVARIGGCLARFDCVQEAVHDAGDHVIIVGRVLSAAFRPGLPLLFQGGRFVSLKG
ncbi:flavin reductase family protein [Mameliella sediminis]|uniref:flavin reductase family protein n=1 Tax=Mameliella sediminis TaxID=2836866 RepID=UPI003CCE9294